ncbi:hypothetical protein BDQ94DRAFT_138435 [Aspergillus welwitschiae]|uniref:Uncharacterized protein n=1 Tax=Aspergillus welwitschiae TaxID=1341132 RepID=A0A3F3QCF1_9EURO|nr:hypothetical protein BDQ94DRAFT_138435 [Aspergillus welwitschiae]RDH36807.1 hypothetical protein BDQ94DRAFT_138435 [Aspergillus welwitschiae]
MRGLIRSVQHGLLDLGMFVLWIVVCCSQCMFPCVESSSSSKKKKKACCSEVDLVTVLLVVTVHI